jgi:outer membrane protein assembly factor BamD (BamD/ComL family)
MLRKILPLAAVFTLMLCGCASRSDRYVLEEQGRTTLRASFDKKKETSADQWTYARATQNKGRLKKAERRMLYLVRRWPNSQEAPWAARARADILLERGKIQKAFDAYQFLIDNYSSRMRDYDSVLEAQLQIAMKLMKRKHMRFLFGGYRAPEYAIEYFEKIIRNGPQWSRAPEAQFLIGQCYQVSKDFEMAIAAYGLLGYRYPDSSYAEEGAWQQIVCLRELRRKYPESPEILDRTLTTTTVFLSTYPNSQYKNQIIRMRNGLYEVKAGKLFDEAAFYAKVPKEPAAAVLYYKSLIEEYPKSQLVPDAERRIADLEELMARPKETRTAIIPRSKPLPFVKDAGNDAG